MVLFLVLEVLFWGGSLVGLVGFLGFFYLLLIMFHIIRLCTQLDTDRATPGKMVQAGRRGGAFFRKDKEKIKIFHPFSHVMVVLEQKRQQQGGCSLSSAPQVNSSASAWETGLTFLRYTILSGQKF